MLESLRNRCRRRGLRLTPQRVGVLEVLAASDAHPSADEVYEGLRRRLPQLARTTVYRILDEFARCGIVRRLHHDGRAVRYDANLRAHHHLHCESCGRIEDVELPALDALLAAQPLGGFERAGASAVFWGRCVHCSRQGAGEGQATQRG